MNVYVFLVIYIIFFWCVTKGGRIWCVVGKLNYKKINVFTFMAFSGSFLLSALRGATVGADTENYIRYYEKIKELDWKGLGRGAWEHKFYTTEKGFMIFEKICNDLMIPTQVFIALCAGIFIYGIYKMANNYIQNSMLMAVFVFLAFGAYLLSMNALRQGIGIGICCIAWVELKRNHFKRFVLLVLFSCTFHISCCVFFLALVFEKITANTKNVLIAVGGTFVLGVAGKMILPYILHWFPVYAVRYGHGRWKINEANGVVLAWAIIIVVVIILSLKIDWSKWENHIDFEIILWALCYVCINIIGLSFDGAQRLSMSFQPFLILLFDRFGGIQKGKHKIIYTTGGIVGMVMFFIKASSTAQYVYQPFWL